MDRIFYTTNTHSNFVLQNVNIEATDPDFFLRCTANTNQRGWGEAGKNGANCVFTAINQKMNGDILWDNASTLDLYMTDGSSLTGTVRKDGDVTGDGHANIVIGPGCRWTVTEESTLTSLQCSGEIVDADGKSVSVVGTDGKTYVKGESTLKVTVSVYSDQADLTGAQSADAWEDHAVARPAAVSVTV